ncbi:MAG: ankyrin repeat domain-containing protein [Piscinibacter sp.]|nr:ankyrin repeat domain-containing protein [Piscinibacter sp.]
MRRKTDCSLPPRRRVLRAFTLLAAPCLAWAPGAQAGGPAPTPLTAWREAIARGRSDVLAALIAGGADLEAADGPGWRPLHLAAMEDFAAGVSMLLAAGARVDARNRRGDTPLHHAGPQAQLLLVAAGADARSTNDLGRVPLHGARQATELLLEPGIDVRDRIGMTPLHVAAFDGNEDKVAWLLGHGADPNARSGAAFDLAAQPGWRDPDPQHRFAPGQRPLDLVRWQHDRVKWSTGRYAKTLDLLDHATPRAGLFRR